MDKVIGKQRGQNKGKVNSKVKVYLGQTTTYVTVWETTKEDTSVGSKPLKKETLEFDTMRSNEASGDNETGCQEEALFKPGATGAAAARSGPKYLKTGAEV